MVTARDRKFDTTELRLSSTSTTQLVFVNDDSDDHNIAIRTEPKFAGEVLFKIDRISKGFVIVPVGPLKPGSYYFLCDIHPQMKGTVVVN